MTTDKGDSGAGLTTAQRAAATLRKRILEGSLAPEAPLREAALIGDLGISRNTLREAFRQLTIEGLTEQKLYAGTIVRRIGPEEVRDIFVARRTLELRAIEEADTARKERRAELKRACEREEEAARHLEWSEAGTASLQFHQAIVGLLGSRKLNDFFEVLAAQLRLAFSEVNSEATFQAPWVSRDREICNLILAGDRQRSLAAMAHYLTDSESILIAVLGATQRPAPDGRRQRGAIAAHAAIETDAA